jgi:sulfur carrier protein ThiS
MTKLKTLEVEKETTVEALLEQEFGEDAGLFFLSVNGEMSTEGMILKPTDVIKAIPMVSGG